MHRLALIVDLDQSLLNLGEGSVDNGTGVVTGSQTVSELVPLGGLVKFID